MSPKLNVQPAKCNNSLKKSQEPEGTWITESTKKGPQVDTHSPIDSYYLTVTLNSIPVVLSLTSSQLPTKFSQEILQTSNLLEALLHPHGLIC